MNNTNSDNKENDLKKRNRRLLNLFTSNGYQVRLVGDSRPMVVLEEKKIISCSVDDFMLYFLKSPGSENVIKFFDLKKDIFLTKYELDEILNRCELLPVYKIKLKGTDLKIVGFCYLKDNASITITKYPAFARYHPYIFANYLIANKAYHDLSEQGYDVELEYS
jgi:hypothetical protein